MKVKIGIVGLGKIGRRHLNAYSSIENVEIRGYCDINDNPSLRANSRLSEATFFDSFEDLVKSKEIEVVDVCVPTYQHHKVILKALEEKKHIFCEKPLTHKLEYAHQIKAKAKQCNKIVMVGYLYRFHPSFELLQDILKKDIIGRPYYAIFRLGGRGGHRAWKHQWDKGGGAVLDMLTHMLDLALFYFGKLTDIKPFFLGTLLKERLIDEEKVRVSSEDCALLSSKTEKGVQVFFISDMITPSFMNLVEVHGDNGSFVGSIIPTFPTILYLKRPRGIYDRGQNVFNYTSTNLIEKELKYFISCILNSDHPNSSVADSIKILEVIEKIRR